MIEVTLPDGSKREFDSPVTVGDVAASIGAGLARAALAGKVNGKLVDLSHPITENSTVSIVTDKDPEGLEIIRHSTSHLMAQAVKELYPEAQITIGPVIENGFYYDFSLPKHLTNEDLPLIEKKMDGPDNYVIHGSQSDSRADIKVSVENEKEAVKRWNE